MRTSGKYAVAWVLSLAFLCWGDELQLKNGKKIAWKSVTIDGDEYIVETLEGQKVRVGKLDVEGFVIDKGSVLTGATFTLDKEKTITVDLLGKADPKGEGAMPGWKKQGTALIGSSTDHIRLPINYAPLPESYDLVLTVERVQGQNDFYVGLVAAGNQFTVHFDAIGGAVSGLQLVDGKTFYEGEGNGTRMQGGQFKPGDSRTIRLMVRKEAFIAQIDGKDFLRWKADWSKVSIQRPLEIPQRDRAFLGLFGSTWKITTVSLAYHK